MAVPPCASCGARAASRSIAGSRSSPFFAVEHDHRHDQRPEHRSSSASSSRTGLPRASATPTAPATGPMMRAHAAQHDHHDQVAGTPATPCTTARRSLSRFASSMPATTQTSAEITYGDRAGSATSESRAPPSCRSLLRQPRSTMPKRECDEPLRTRTGTRHEHAERPRSRATVLFASVNSPKSLRARDRQARRRRRTASGVIARK